ncbi:MAG TPA: hypothetical protein VNS32_23635 [Flavisolibacter sp.]|nr:hypothetical protein [Flavisolibacter sp.]
MELKKEFTCVVDVNAQPIELSFRLVHVPRGGKYFVEASTLKGITSSFELISDAHQNWQIVPPVPYWLTALEERLSAIVLEKAKG